MLSTAVNRTTCSICRRRIGTVVENRALSTDSLTSHSSSPQPPPPPPISKQQSKSRPRFAPTPRAPGASRHQALPHLPANFGQNQLLSVPNSTRALLESIVSRFRAPIRYAFAYGSGVFEQDGYETQVKAGKQPMLDFMFAVTHASHWHSINMAQYPSHYPLHARMFGSDFVSRVQDVGPGIWFNPYVNINDVNIKYGVTTVDNLCSDLLNWQTLYLAGRMHKPLRIIKDDARVRLTQQVNLTSALRVALLTLPERFSDTELFERIASLSYDGDPRMILPAENREKIRNIVSMQGEQFRELYHRLAIGLPGVHWPATASMNTSVIIQQDINPRARAAHLKKLPPNLLNKIVFRYSGPNMPPKETDESLFWQKVSAEEDLSRVLRNEMKSIVRYPATLQAAKGLVSAGVGKSIRYSASKVGKWWSGTKSSSKTP